MVSNDHNSVEEIIVKAIGNVNKILKIDAIVNGESCPVNFNSQSNTYYSNGENRQRIECCYT